MADTVEERTSKRMAFLLKVKDLIAAQLHDPSPAELEIGVLCWRAACEAAAQVPLNVLRDTVAKGLKPTTEQVVYIISWGIAALAD